jgi:hypothetical protein
MKLPQKTKKLDHICGSGVQHRLNDISTSEGVEFNLDGHQAPLREWCAAHTDDITSVGMVFNKQMIAFL